MTMSQNKRRFIPIIDARFQWKYTCMIIAVAAVAAAAVGYFLWRAYDETSKIVALIAEIPELSTMFSTADFERVFLYTGVTLVLGVIIVGVAGLIITHRMCGPVYVMTQLLDVIVQGKWPKLRPLRESDEFHTMFNTLAVAIEKMRTQDAQELVALQQILKAHGKTLSSADASAVEKMITVRETRLQL
jgi:signal transduction histidine kinase